MASSNSKSKPLNEETGKFNTKYRECRRNHAILIGGFAVDGCGEFTPKGDQGTEEALLCDACDCHRNFHRKEVIKNGITLLDTHHMHSPSPYGLYSPMWVDRNAFGLYPLPASHSRPSLPPYFQHSLHNNVSNVVHDEESLIDSVSES